MINSTYRTMVLLTAFVLLLINLDVKPFVDFYNGSYIYVDGGISLRYVF